MVGDKPDRGNVLVRKAPVREVSVGEYPIKELTGQGSLRRKTVLRGTVLQSQKS